MTKSVNTLNKHLLAGETITRVCLDEYAKMCFCYTSQHRLLCFDYNSEAAMTIKHTVDMKDENPNLESSELVMIAFVQEFGGVSLAYKVGNMYTVKFGGSTPVVAEVGEIPDGILAASWAPNQDHLAVATTKLMLLLTPEFDVPMEQALDDDDLTFDQSDKVRDSAIKDACISWRGDSQIFVCTYWINGGRKCLTRDVSQGMQVTKGPARADNQVVFSVAEKPIPTLALPTCIMPNGSLVTGFQNRILPNKQI